MTAPLLEVADLSVEFPLRRQRLQALDRISFSLEAGEVLLPKVRQELPVRLGGPLQGALVQHVLAAPLRLLLPRAAAAAGRAVVVLSRRQGLVAVGAEDVEERDVVSLAHGELRHGHLQLLAQRPPPARRLRGPIPY